MRVLFSVCRKICAQLQKGVTGAMAHTYRHVTSTYMPRGGTFTKIERGCACRPQKLDFLYTNFSHKYPPISIPFLKQKHPILLKLGVFYHNLLKIHPIYVFELLHL